jgi:hypothetical protein
MQAELIAGSDTMPGRLDTQVPLIASVPAGPPVSILSVTATIGPAGLTYYAKRHGRRVAFHPRGVSVPRHCPRGGFRFSARFSFTFAFNAMLLTVPQRRRLIADLRRDGYTPRTRSLAGARGADSTLCFNMTRISLSH